MIGRVRAGGGTGAEAGGAGVGAVALALGAAAILMTAPPAEAQEPAEGIGTEDGRWAYIGGDAWHTRYSPLDQVTRDNVGDLEVAWTWSEESFGPPTTARETPIYVDGMLITAAGPRRSVVALDAATGSPIWSFREPDTFRWEYSMRQNHGKGVAYAEVDGQGVIYITTPGFFLYALDAETGKPLEGWGDGIPIEGFPENSGVDPVPDLLDGWGPWEDYDGTYDPEVGIPLELGYLTTSSPPIVVNDVVIVGNTSEQGYEITRNENAPGDILAYDARTGEFLWKFHVIAQPGDEGHDTWENDAWEWSGNANAWAPLSADPELGLVYIPTKAPNNDFFGGHRPGDNLYANSVVALDVETGERVWHYQIVRHDLWNYDTPNAPLLVDVTVDGEEIPAVVQTTKQNLVFSFDRETGEPLWPIEDQEVPQSEVPGEQAAETQPFPTRPEPVDIHGISEDDLIDFTPELREQALEMVENVRMGPLYNPPLHMDNEDGKDGAIWCPGSLGGMNILGPPAADPESGVVFMTNVRGCSSNILIPGEDLDPAADGGDPLNRPIGSTPAEFAAGPQALSWRNGPEGLPLLKPPYSRITAVDMNTGEHLWWVPVGETPDDIREHEALEGVDVGETGTGDFAALMTTPELLFYTGEASDGTPYLFALDKETGEELERVEIPAPGRYGMMGYEHQGEQYVLVQMSGELAALKLP